MNRSVRPIAATLLAGSLGAVLLAGCGSGDSTDAASSRVTTSVSVSPRTSASTSATGSTTASPSATPSASASLGAGQGSDPLAGRPAAQGMKGKVGQVITYPNGLKISVDGGTRKAPADEMETNGQQIAVRLLITNTGTKAYDSSTDLVALNCAGEAVGEATDAADTKELPASLAPGQQVVATYYFFGDAAQAKTAEVEFQPASLDTATWTGDLSGALPALK